MGLTGFQRSRRLTNENVSYPEATDHYLGVGETADAEGKFKTKAEADIVKDYDERKPASIGEGEGDNNKGVDTEPDYTGLPYSAATKPGDNQKNHPENLESLKTDAPLKTVDETQKLLEGQPSEAPISTPDPIDRTRKSRKPASPIAPSDESADG